MIAEPTRMLTAWLQHPVHGVAALLPLVPRQRPDGTNDPLPATPLIYNDVDTEGLAGDVLDAPTSPALIVYCDDTLPFKVAKQTAYHVAERPLLLLVAYCTQDVPAVDAVIGGGYTLRAVKRSLQRYNKQMLSVGYRELNGIRIAALNGITEVRVAGAVGNTKLWGFVQTTATVIDTLP